MLSVSKRKKKKEKRKMLTEKIIGKEKKKKKKTEDLQEKLKLRSLDLAQLSVLCSGVLVLITSCC